MLVFVVLSSSLLVAPSSSSSARQEAGAVPVRFTAAAKDGAPVLTLKREDVRVVAEGGPRELVAFELERDVPLALAFLIDVSASQERVLPATKKAAVALLSTTLRDGVDRVAVVSFTGEATLEESLTGDLVKARRALERVEFVAPAGYIGGGVVVSGSPPSQRGRNQRPLTGATSLWDAVWATCEDLLSPAKGGEQRVIVLLSDGVDTSSRKKADEALRSAIKSNTTVYAVGIGDKFFEGVDKGSLRKLAERTGGRAFFPENTGELLSTFEQVRRELSARYVASFVPQAAARAGDFQKVRVELVNAELRRRGVRLAHAEGYFTGRPTGAAKD